MLLKLLGQVSSFIPLRERWDGPPAWRPGALSSTADDERRSWPHCAPGPCAPGQTGATHVTKAAAAMNPSSNTAGFAKPRRAMTVVMRWPRPGPQLPTQMQVGVNPHRKIVQDTVFALLRLRARRPGALDVGYGACWGDPGLCWRCVEPYKDKGPRICRPRAQRPPVRRLARGMRAGKAEQPPPKLPKQL